MITEQSSVDVWLVHEPDQRPVEGVAVYYYVGTGFLCDQCGISTCDHVQEVKTWKR